MLITHRLDIMDHKKIFLSLIFFVVIGVAFVSGIGIGVSKIQYNRASESLGLIYGFMWKFHELDKHLHSEISFTQQRLHHETRSVPKNLTAKDWAGDDWYGIGFKNGIENFEKNFPNGVKTLEEKDKFKIMLNLYYEQWRKSYIPILMIN